MDIHPILRPRLQKIEGPIGKVEIFAGKIMGYPVVLDETPGLPQHDSAKDDSEVGQKRRVHWLEEDS
jgi:hypothetical protein